MPTTELAALLSTMAPIRHPGAYVFALVAVVATDFEVQALQPIATIREPEGCTVVIEESIATAAGLPVMFRAAWITLSVHSALNAVGFTAAFSSALGSAGISCNVMAGVLHDHLFVPYELGDLALETLLALAR